MQHEYNETFWSISDIQSTLDINIRTLDNILGKLDCSTAHNEELGKFVIIPTSSSKEDLILQIQNQIAIFNKQNKLLIAQLATAIIGITTIMLIGHFSLKSKLPSELPPKIENSADHKDSTNRSEEEVFSDVCSSLQNANQLSRNCTYSHYSRSIDITPIRTPKGDICAHYNTTIPPELKNKLNNIDPDWTINIYNGTNIIHRCEVQQLASTPLQHDKKKP